MNARWSILAVAACLGVPALAISSHAAADQPAETGHAAAVAAYWTPERIASAQPRDLVVDERGQGYLRAADGTLTPRGNAPAARLVQVAPAAAPTAKAPNARPSGGGGDSTPPTIVSPSPASGAGLAITTEDPVEFSATVTDTSGIRSVTVVIEYPSGATQSFSGVSLGGDRWGTVLSGFTPGTWRWRLIAKDGASKGGNTETSDWYPFEVTNDGGTPPPPDPDFTTVTNSRWTTEGGVKTAAGRILFEMQVETRRGRRQWQTYVCSGTAVTDSRTDASIILSAAHCIYDDALGQFARNVLFIPNQDDGGTDRTDSICSNDPLGCWAPTTAVVEVDYTTRTFPDNNAWDYGYYVVPNTGAHSGTGTATSLEAAVDELTIEFDKAAAPNVTHALGYSYADDPNFMYCAEATGTINSGVNWWLPSCGLTGGSSGGPWVQPMENGTGPIISVNSWGYVNQPGMAGPKLGAEASCTFDKADTIDLPTSVSTSDPLPGTIAICSDP